MRVRCPFCPSGRGRGREEEPAPIEKTVAGNVKKTSERCAGRYLTGEATKGLPYEKTKKKEGQEGQREFYTEISTGCPLKGEKSGRSLEAKNFRGPGASRRAGAIIRRRQGRVYNSIRRITLWNTNLQTPELPT